MASTTFGYFLSSEELTPRELVETAQQAAAAGFDRVWISDHFHPWLEEQGQSAFVWSVLGAIAATTELRLTTAVTCPTYRIHPAVIAQATATVAALAPGRFLFGVGSGENLNEHILGDAWQSTEVRLERLGEAIDIIRRLWTGETVNHRGRHYTVDRARIFSRPENPPPILVSGFGPEATELAARVGDGWVTTSPTARSSSTTGRQAVAASPRPARRSAGRHRREPPPRPRTGSGASRPSAARRHRSCRRGRSSLRAARPGPRSRADSPSRAGPMPTALHRRSRSTSTPGSTRSTSRRWARTRPAASASSPRRCCRGSAPEQGRSAGQREPTAG